MSFPWDSGKKDDDTNHEWLAPKLERNRNGKVRDVLDHKKISDDVHKRAGDRYENECEFYERNLQCQSEIEQIPHELSECGLDPRLVANCKNNLQFTMLNPCQTRTVPILRSRNCIRVEAPTGMGKTASFLLPTIQSMIDLKRDGQHENEIRVLCLSNTTDIAQQTYMTAMKMLQGSKIESVTVELMCGGHQGRHNNADIVVGCGGTLHEKLKEEKISLKNLQYLIIDEADKMLGYDNNFRQNVEDFYEAIDSRARKTLTIGLFSATFDDDIEDTIADVFKSNLKQFHTLTIPSQPGAINQRMILVQSDMDPVLDKIQCIMKIVDEELTLMNCRKNGPFKHTMVIFCEKKTHCQILNFFLLQAGYKFRVIHSGQSRTENCITKTMMKNCEIQGIVCTNKMARGVDIRTIKHVVVFQMNTDFSLYKHRVGRTGRAGDSGRATVLVHEYDTLKGMVRNLIEFFEEHNQDIPRWVDKWLDIDF